MIGKEIDQVYTVVDGFKGLYIAPGSIKTIIKPFSMINRNYQFDYQNGVLVVSGRNKYERKITTKSYQLEVVGYKLPTTHLEEGLIWGNPKEL